jgi:hypothetical protein
MQNAALLSEIQGNKGSAIHFAVYLPAFLIAFFAEPLPALPGFEDDPLALVLAGVSSGISLLAMGEPSPVQASQPGPAEKAPLLPTVMSLNAEAT